MNNNNLTRYGAGGTHESSKFGGIPMGISPQGGQNLVEQGETRNGDFINSNRLFIDADLIKTHNLPTYIKGKTFAKASELIDDKFKDRQDKYAQETRSTLMSRLGEAQEALKQQEQIQQERINQSLQANSQEIPDQSNGQIPQGMEEYSEQGQSIPEQGGPGLPQSNQMMSAMGGYLTRRYDDGGYIQGDNNLDGIVDAKDSVDKFGNAITSTGGSGTPSPGGMLNMAGTAMDLGNTAFGKAAQDTSGQAASGHADATSMIGSSAMKGAQAGMALGPIGAGVGLVVGGAAGLMGLQKERKAEQENTRNFAANVNRNLSDNYAAYGGYLMAQGGGLTGEDRGSDARPYPSVSKGDFAGGGRSYPIPTRADAVDALRLAGLHGRADVRSKVFAKYPDLKHALGGQMYADGGYYQQNNIPGSPNYGQPTPQAPQPQEDWYSKNPPSPQLQAGAAPYNQPKNWYDANPPAFVDPTAGPYDASKANKVGTAASRAASATGKAIGAGAKKAGEFASENAGEAMRFAPIAMNAYQLATLGKPTGVNYAQSAARFKPGYVDEAAMQRTVDQEATNQIRGLQESGASQGAVRAATLAAGLNKTKALGEAYQNAAAQNRATDVQGQMFNRDIDMSNIATRNKSIDENRADQAARRSAKSQLLGSIGTDVGAVGKELSDDQLVGQLTGYSRRGKYLIKPDGTKATPAEIAQTAALYRQATTKPTTTDSNTLPKLNALGGYLTRKPSKY